MEKKKQKNQKTPKNQTKPRTTLQPLERSELPRPIKTYPRLTYQVDPTFLEKKKLPKNPKKLEQPKAEKKIKPSLSSIQAVLVGQVTISQLAEQP